MAESKEEQARKALASAEEFFLAGDVAGARRWAQSALNLAPALPGAAQAAVAYDVHAAAAARGPLVAADWYAVLGLDLPRSGSGVVVTHDAVKRQHRRLCLLVHPDKNPSAAADGAFKLVQAACDALSASHPPPAATNARHPLWEEEQELFPYTSQAQAAASWTTMPKQPPIARPPPRRTAPPPMPPQQPTQMPWAHVAQTPRRARQPSKCYFYPLCTSCRLCRATTGFFSA